ncbi:MAG: DUF86 domain-containing protein [Sandaracinaceae bacterium]|nr:DUF86 domain-containing protein [Sandaracinaceae bacterium]
MTRGDLADEAAFVRAALAELEAIPQSTYDEFLADRRNLPAAIHWIQTAIQALIDIGLVSIAARGLPTPRSSAEVLERLEAAGALPAGTSVKYRPVVGFRDRVVHLYDRVDPEIVYRILTEDRSDLADLLGLLLTSSEE